jgi:hypothetical protein
MIEAIHSKPRTGRRRSEALPDIVRLRRAAWAFTTRRVRGGVCGVAIEAMAPKAGDLVLARVDAVGYHSALQLPEGRRKHLFIGDEIVVAYGNRYAPNQFEAVVPKTLGPCQLVAAGGVAGKALSWHASVSKSATQITPLGILTDAAGRAVNLRDHALPSVDRLPAPWPPTIAVVGTAMDSGKTQTAAHLVRGLAVAGLQTGYAKVTGTGSGGDTWLLKDAGAHPVLDFTDAGLVSTYLASPVEVQRVFVTLMAHLMKSRVDAVVLEIADGVLQEETAALLESTVFREVVGGILFASGDAMGAVAGHTWLRSRNLPLIGLSGVLTSSPLQRRESARETGLPVYSRQELSQAMTAMSITALAGRRLSEPARADERGQLSRDVLASRLSEAAPAVRRRTVSVAEVIP